MLDKPRLSVGDDAKFMLRYLLGPALAAAASFLLPVFIPVKPRMLVMIPAGMVGVGMTFFVAGLSVLRNPYARKFLTAKGLVALLVRPGRKVDIVKAEFVKPNIVKAGGKYFAADHNDVFYGPGGVNWIVLAEGSSIVNGLGLWIKPGKKTRIAVKPNYVYKTQDGEVYLYINPSADELKRILEDVKDDPEARVISGMAIEMDPLLDKSFSDYYIDAMGEVRAQQQRLMEEDRFKSLVKLGFVFLPMCVGLGIILMFVKALFMGH